jgi:hypothetical protein
MSAIAIETQTRSEFILAWSFLETDCALYGGATAMQRIRRVPIMRKSQPPAATESST